jgi:hypothetical protein
MVMVIMMRIIMVMSMTKDYVSDLRPPIGLVFIHLVIYEHGEPWRNDIDRENLLIHLPQHSVNPSSSHLAAKLDELAK